MHRVPHRVLAESLFIHEQQSKNCDNNMTDKKNRKRQYYLLDKLDAFLHTILRPGEVLILGVEIVTPGDVKTNKNTRIASE